MKTLATALFLASGAFTVQPVLAQVEGPPDSTQAVNPLRQSVMKGLANSPVLDADVHALEAQIEESNVVYGSLRPTVDARGSAGRERTRIDDGEARTYNASSYGIEARQNLYNGFASQARYFAAHSGAMQSYYRYLNKANQVAFESASAHIDVARFQALIRLSESNLKYHQDLMNRIEEKVKSGVSRQSDLEQARSRYTLSLSNLTTEKANAFSALATYQRVTDTVWPVNQPGEYVVDTNFEVENRERLVFALNNHPLLKASNAQINSAKLEITAASEGFHPRIDLRAKSDVYSNYLSTFDERQISSVDLLATINLYRGGADSAQRKAAIKRRLQSMDDKLAMCRLIRQSTQTALFDVVSQQKKLVYFREQAAAITKARAAYEQQFSVGRRDLLDLLSAENEYYQAQRALINVEADL
ncbi:MAG TPA: TolC family protein, partial [Limnobacter sp.]|nr:TolC family protein [Limnobacter sp.]